MYFALSSTVYALPWKEMLLRGVLLASIPSLIMSRRYKRTTVGLILSYKMRQTSLETTDITLCSNIRYSPLHYTASFH